MLERMIDMVDPATIAMAAKAAIAAATDKRTWQMVGAVIAGVVFVLLLPLLLITTIMSGGAEHNKSAAEIVFNGGAIPPGYSAEYIEHIQNMQAALADFDVIIIEKNKEIEGDSLDAIRIKAVFYGLYFGTDFSWLDEEFYRDFVEAFAGSPTDIEAVYTRLTPLIGRIVTETEKANINNLYFQIKYGYVVNGLDPGIPGEAFDDEAFAALMAEATKYIGYPYVWGGSTPSESFDCSGFICWSYTKSGVYNLPRTTAQGIFNQCAIVSKDEIKPGDLVFFTKTYDSVNPVTHIAIYVGNDKILHAGDPIGYADLNDAYYKKHFYACGRLN